ncbi:MAG: hypothetical protein QFX35_04025 [Candidatus Verstraetearchaeota archaeon]|nr:hypothetical protein [Candidatus Verstraetearchaeota archaeon]
MQIGFEPKVVFLCPLCSKEVEMVYDRSEGWTAEHGGCLNFSLIRKVPSIQGREFRAPLVFMELESDFSVKEAVEELRRLISDERDLGKKSKLESGIRKLESKIGFADKKLPELLEVVKGGSFGIKVVSGRAVYALVWKATEKFAGLAYGGGADDNLEGLIFTSSMDEVREFVLRWLHNWERTLQLPRKKEGA